jgi:hypothetical protein
MILWPLAIPIPNKNLAGAPRKRAIFISCYLAYGLSAVVSVAYYFRQYVWPHAAPPSAKLTQLPQIIDFMTVWLGGVLRSDVVQPRIPGVVVTAAICVAITLSLVFVYRNRSSWKAYYPWFILAAFSLGTGLIIAVGRVNIGTGLVFNRWFDGYSGMKYNISAVFAYVAAIGLFANLYRDWIHRRLDWNLRFIIILTVCFTLLSDAWAYQFSEELTRLHWFQQNRRRARAAVTWANALPNNPEIFKAYPFPAGFPDTVEAMRKAGLIKLPLISEKLKRAVEALPAGLDNEGGNLDLLTIQEGTHFRVAGWGRNPRSNSAADYVVLGWVDSDHSFHPFTVVPTGHTRLDLIAAFNSSAMRNAGFEQDIDVSPLPKRPVVIKAWAVDLKQQEVFPVGGSFEIKLPSP